MALSSIFSVIRAFVPKLDLDSAFEQKNDIAQAVEEELEKVIHLNHHNLRGLHRKRSVKLNIITFLLVS